MANGHNRAADAPLSYSLASVESGIPLTAMHKFVAAHGLEMKDLYDIVIPARTLKHRRTRKEPLSRDESDKLLRTARIFDKASHVFGDADAAKAWLFKPKKRFENRTPFRMLQTELGGRMVEEMLIQIDAGMFA